MSEMQSGLVSISSDGLAAEIDPHGAQLHALRDREQRDLLWDGDAAIWTGRAPILFPIIGMLEQGCYRVGGKTYQLEKHGFARRKTFEVIDRTGASATFRLQADEPTLAVYPFAFQLDIRFALDGSTLTVTASVRNVGQAMLPASFGFHPALRWPLPFGRSRSAHRIRFEAPEPAPIRRIDREGLVTPTRHPTPVRDRTLALADALFADDAVIFDQLSSQRLDYGADAGPRLEVAFPDTPYLGVWTKPGAGFICIEPWHGIADPKGYAGDFYDKPGVFHVAPGATRELSLSITLKAS